MMLATAKEVRKFRGFGAEPRRGRNGGWTGRGSHLAAGRGKGHAGQRFEAYVYALVRRGPGFGAFIFWLVRHFLAQDIYGYRYGSTAVLVGRVIAINVLVVFCLLRK